MAKKQSLKLSLSFKETARDLQIYNKLIGLKDEIPYSAYIKSLIEKDMKDKNEWIE